MIGRILDFSVQQRWAVVVIMVIAVAIGAWSLVRLPIDAVPDITNNQAQINTLAPSLSPYEIEKQVTLPIGFCRKFPQWMSKAWLARLVYSASE